MITDTDKHIIKAAKEVLENTPLNRELLKQYGFEKRSSGEYYEEWSYKKAETYGVNPVTVQKTINGVMLSCNGSISLTSGGPVLCDIRTLRHLKTYIQLSKKSLRLHNIIKDFYSEIRSSELIMFP